MNRPLTTTRMVVYSLCDQIESFGDWGSDNVFGRSMVQAKTSMHVAAQAYNEQAPGMGN